jgi:hypothetical protein
MGNKIEIFPAGVYDGAHPHLSSLSILQPSIFPLHTLQSANHSPRIPMKVKSLLSPESGLSHQIQSMFHSCRHLAMSLVQFLFLNTIIKDLVLLQLHFSHL